MTKFYWKEWQQQKWYIIIGLILGTAFPAISYFYQWIKGYTDIQTESGQVFLLLGGAFYAGILAIASMHHDTRKGTDTFLLSKPIDLGRFFTAKFIFGVCLLAIIFLAFISIDMITVLTEYLKKGQLRTGNSSAWAVFSYTYPIALLLYAASIFLMVVMRDTAKAAFATMWMGLLVYFLPLVVAQLHWMSIFEQLETHQDSLVYHLVSRYSHRQEERFSVWLRDVLSGYPWKHWVGYLSFLAVMLLGAIGFIRLSIKAERNHWRWQPQQKSIVWIMGVSAAVIFALAMLQVGHNLMPAKEYNGKPLVNPLCLDWSEGIASLNEGLPEGQKIVPMLRYLGDEWPLCVKDGLLFYPAIGYQANESEERSDRDWVMHFVLLIYRFPFAHDQNSDSDSGSDTNFLVSATPFFQTKPTDEAWNQLIIGSFIRNDRLYVVYRPRHIRETDADDNHRYPGSLNPMYIATFDISDPALPKVIANTELSRSDLQTHILATQDHYCYIDEGIRLIVLSLKEPDNPEVIGRIDVDDEDAFLTESRKAALERESRFMTSHRQLLMDNDQLIYSDSHRVRIMDITDRLNPRTVYDETLVGRYLDDAIMATYYKNGRLFAATNGGIYIFELEPDNDGVYTSRLIGQRRATTLEILASRRPRNLLLQGSYLIEQSGYFGVLVYDVSSPSMPRRVYHAQTSTSADRIGFWEGLLYAMNIENKLYLFEMADRTKQNAGERQ